MIDQPQRDVPTGFRQVDYTGIAMDPNNPPWNSGIALVVWVLSVLMIIFIPALLLIPYVFSQLGPGTEAEKLSEFAAKDPTALVIQVAAILPVHLITIAICWYVVTNFKKYPFLQTLGWDTGGVRWWHHLLILAGFVTLMVVVGRFIPEQENDLLRILKSSKLALYTVALLAVFTAPFVEEVVYRGVLYSAFQRSLGRFAAIALVTFLFALVHVPQYWPSYSTIFLLTLLSLILTLVRVYSGNLLPCVILHTIFNGFQSALLIAEPHLNMPGTPNIEQAAAMFMGISWN